MPDWRHCLTEVREQEPLGPLTTWKIGGPARYLAEPADVEALSVLLREAERQGVRPYVLGGGSNLLITDETVDGLVLRLASGGALGSIAKIDRETCLVYAGAAVPLARLVGETVDQGLAGLPELAGIPGTLGGAVRRNAGSPGRGIGAFVESVEAVDLSGRRQDLDRLQMRFAYRWSNLRNLVVTGVTLRLRKGKRSALETEAAMALEAKRRHQPLGAKSAGCVFKNPRLKSAGMLISGLGLNGFRVGDAEVSRVHANFIVNKGAATCEQTRRLIAHVRREVRRVHEIDLRLEVQLWV